MTPYWIGLTAGFVLGIGIGFVLCTIIMIAEREDREREDNVKKST